MMTRNHFWYLLTPKYFQSVARLPSFFQDCSLFTTYCAQGTAIAPGRQTMVCVHLPEVSSLPLSTRTFPSHGSAVWALRQATAIEHTNKSHHSKSVRQMQGPSLYVQPTTPVSVKWGTGGRTLPAQCVLGDL